MLNSEQTSGGSLNVNYIITLHHNLFLNDLPWVQSTQDVILENTSQNITLGYMQSVLNPFAAMENSTYLPVPQLYMTGELGKSFAFVENTTHFEHVNFFVPIVAKMPMKTRIQRLHQQKGYYKREVSSIIEERDKYVPKLLYESGWREERIKMGNDRVCCFVYHVSLTGKSLLKQRTLVITRWKNMTYGNRKLHLTWQKEMGEKPHRIFSRVANGKEKSGFAKGMDNTILFYELKNQHKPLTLKIAEEKWKQGYNGFIVAFATKNAIIFCEIHGLKLIIIGKQLMSREFYGKLKRDCLQQKNTIPAEMLDHGFLIYENEEELESWFKKWINEVN